MDEVTYLIKPIDVFGFDVINIVNRQEYCVYYSQKLKWFFVKTIDPERNSFFNDSSITPILFDLAWKGLYSIYHKTPAEGFTKIYKVNKKDINVKVTIHSDAKVTLSSPQYIRDIEFTNTEAINLLKCVLDSCGCGNATKGKLKKMTSKMIQIDWSSIYA